MPTFFGKPTKTELETAIAEQKATIAEQKGTIERQNNLIQTLKNDYQTSQEQIAALMEQVTSLEDTLKTYDDDLERKIEETQRIVKDLADEMVENAREEEQAKADKRIREIEEKSRQAMEKAASREEIMRLTKRYEEYLGFEQSIQQKGETQSLADFVKGITKDCLSGLNQPNKVATAKAIYYGNWVGMLYGLTLDDDDKRKTALKPEQKKTIINNIRPYLLRYKFSGDDKVDSAFHDAYMSAAIKAGYIDLNDMDILEIFDRFFVTPEKGMKGRLEKVVEEFEPKHGAELSQKPSSRKGILARLGLRRKKENVKALPEGQTNEVKEPNSEEVPKNKLPEQTPIEALTSINNPKFIFRILEGFISLYKEEANTNRENQTVYNDYLLVSILSKHLCSLLSDKGLIYGNKQKLISLKDKLSSLPAHQYEGNQLDFSLVIETIDKLLQKIEQKQVETKPQQEL